MKDLLIKKFINDLGDKFSEKELRFIEEKLVQSLNGLDLTRSTDGTEGNDYDVILQKYLNSKKIEGHSFKTISYYEKTIKKVLSVIDKNVKLISTEDIR